MVDEITIGQANLDSAEGILVDTPSRGHVPVVIVGGGQAGLCSSWFLKQRGIGHVVLEKNQHRLFVARGTLGHVLPGDAELAVQRCRIIPIRATTPDGFMVKDQIVEYLEGFARKVDAPIHEGVTVTKITRSADGTFLVKTTKGDWTTDHVVMAISGYHLPSIPRVGERFPLDLHQIHSQAYRNPQAVTRGRGADRRHRPSPAANSREGLASRRAQSACRRRQRPPFAARVPWQGHDPLASRDGLLRHDGGQPPARHGGS